MRRMLCTLLSALAAQLCAAIIAFIWGHTIYFGHHPQVSVAFDGGRIWVATPYEIVFSVPISLVIAVAIGAVVLIPVIRFGRKWGWRDPRYPAREGCCACGYNLAGNESGVCPECGKRHGAAIPH